MTVTKRMIEMTDELVDELGYNSRADAITAAVIAHYRKTFPLYNQQKTAKELATPRDRITARIEEEKVREEMNRETQLAILAELGGTLSDKVGEADKAVWYTYNYKKRYEQRMPLKMLTTELLKSQFYPNRKTVEKLQKDGLTTYKIDVL